MSGGFQLRLLRALSINGRRMLAGSELTADAVTARQMIEAGTARLVDDADLQRLVELVGTGRRVPVTR